MDSRARLSWTEFISPTITGLIWITTRPRSDPLLFLALTKYRDGFTINFYSLHFTMPRSADRFAPARPIDRGIHKAHVVAS